MNKKPYRLLLLLTTVFSMTSGNFSVFADKPAVWIYTDMSDKTLPGNNSEGTINDPDDISAMAGYLLMCNMFDTRGIVVTSTHRSEHKTTPDQGVWANNFLGGAYRKDVANLNANIGGYPEDITFMQSCIKETAERFSSNKDYRNIDGYSTVKALVDHVGSQDDIIYVLCWGSTTEPAIAVKHCVTTNKTSVLSKIRIIAHWTNSSLHQGTPDDPENVANCKEDKEACRYLKERAVDGIVHYYECGAIGQHGIVSGAPTGTTYFNQFKKSNIGKIFAEGKYAYNKVDHSDAATYWTLIGTWGVSLSDIAKDGSNPMAVEQANENKFKNNSKRIHDELLRRSDAAAATPITQKENPLVAGLYPVVLNTPFSKTTSIRYSVPEQTKVSLNLLDIRGRQVCTILDETVCAGEHTVLFNATYVPSGVYVIRMEACGAIWNCKLMITR